MRGLPRAQVCHWGTHSDTSQLLSMAEKNQPRARERTLRVIAGTSQAPRFIFWGGV